MKIYVNGDSYAGFSDGKRYSDFLGEFFNCDVVNSAISGSCNTRILRTSLRDLLEIKKTHDSAIAVISLTFTVRKELWDTSSFGKTEFVNDGDFRSITLVESNNWFQDIDNSLMNQTDADYKKQQLIWFDIEAETVNLLTEIILFAAWCKLNNIKYVIFSGPIQESVDFTAPFIKDFYDAVMSDGNVIDMFTNSFTEYCINRGFAPIDHYIADIHGKTYNVGHHGESAHRDFANFLIENYLT